MQQILKENITYILLILIILIGGLMFVGPKFPEVFNAATNTLKLKKELDKENVLLEQLRVEANSRVSRVAEGSKKIYEVQGMQFSPDASFAPLFESLINIARSTGVRFRSIQYNYQPNEDIVYTAKITGYNVCELDIVAVGTYTQFQNFFKGLIKEEYLNSLAEIEIKPFTDDRSILVANLKLRLYTKTSDAETLSQPTDMGI